MNLRAMLAKRPDKPYLFYGPALSGKTTLLQQTLEELEYDFVNVVDRSELTNTIKLQYRTVYGRTAYIAKITALNQLLNCQNNLTVVYVCINPYDFATAKQLQEKFTLVDLTKQLNGRALVRQRDAKTHSDLRDSFQSPPWQSVSEFGAAKTYCASEVVFERAPELFNITLHNIDQCLNITALAEQLETISLLESKFPTYIDHSPHHRHLLATRHLLPLVRTKQLNYKKETKPQAPNFTNIYYYSQLVKRPAATLALKTQPSKKQRAAPRCRNCNVPLKGHKCSKKPS